MSISIYCSPTHLKVLVGKVSGNNLLVSDFDEPSLPEGGMINGIITNEDAMISFLRETNDRLGLSGQDTHLVIDNNNIRSKVMELPPVSEAKMLEFIGRELGQFGQFGQDGAAVAERSDVFDYAVLEPKSKEGGVKVLAVAVGRELLETYRDTFEKAGYELKSINIGVNAQIKLAAFVPELNTGTYILAQVDDRNLALTMFVDGHYTVANKYRLMNEQSTFDWYSEIGTNISSMIQFNKGQHHNSEISETYFAGLKSTEITEIRSALSYLGIEIKELDLSGSVSLSGKAAEKQGIFNSGSFLLNIGTLVKK
ncbi:MAG: hypothetical protein LBN34_03305 [Clostridiales Family XIII bacterium]|jgi:Tfp pilus assembly PilM family ATPase|nr:hypothetical protein [Clostridiales Family XIII bacterium]